MANEILQQLEYDINKTQLVQQCIKNHRGSISNNKTTVEELCVADADAISHFDNLPSLLYLASWHVGHIRYFKEEGNELRYEFSDDMPVVFEDFEVVYQI